MTTHIKHRLIVKGSPWLCLAIILLLHNWLG